VIRSADCGRKARDYRAGDSLGALEDPLLLSILPVPIFAAEDGMVDSGMSQGNPDHAGTTDFPNSCFLAVSQMAITAECFSLLSTEIA